MFQNDIRYTENVSPLLQVQSHINVECGNHFHENSEFILVKSGVLHMQIDGISYSIPESHAAFVPPFTAHEFHSPNFNRCQVLVFSNELIPALYHFTKTHTVTQHIFPLNQHILPLVNALLPDQSNIDDPIAAQAVLSLLCLETKEKCRFTPKSSAFLDKFYSIVEYLQSNFLSTITLESVAKKFYMHPVTLSKLFKEKSKTNFNEYLNYLRSSHAAFLIKNTSLSLAEIAFEAGFGSIRNFNRNFSKFYNKTPSEYKQS